MRKYYPKPNRYANKRRHKLNMKRKYGRGIYTQYRDNIWLHEQECRDHYCDDCNIRNGGYEYWQTYYLSGPRRYAKWCTNRAIRAYYRDQIRKLDEEMLEDLQGLKGADYEKMFDYMWTVW